MNQLTIIDHKGQRVLTTQQLAEKYETEPRRISENFTRNQERYINGTHYFVIKRGEEGYTQFADSPYANQPIYLWTEKGCLLHAKSLGTDKAWEVYEMLVDTYFRVKELQQPKTREQVILEGYQSLLGLVDELKPKAEYFDALVDRNLLTNFRDTAQELKVKEGNLIQWLIDRDYVYRDGKGKIKPYAPYVDKLFEVKEYRNRKNDHVGTQTLITPRGRETFRLLLQN